MILNLSNFTLQLGEYTDLSVPNLTILDDSKIGLIGKNGSGKSTLLKRIKEAMEKKNKKVSLVDQHFPKNEESIFEYVSKHVSNYWDIKSTDDFEHKVSALSGGERMVLEIEIAYLKNPELILLDEPTNHLDIENKKFLKEMISNSQIACIIASHDTKFLDDIINTLWVVENNKISLYNSNYSTYKTQREIELESQARKFEVSNKKVRSIEERIKKDNERIQKTHTKLNASKTDRSTDRFSKGFFAHFGEINETKTKSKNERDLQLALQIKNELKITKSKTAYINFSSNNFSNGQNILSIKEEILELNPKTKLQNINLKIDYPDRIEIKGKNGSGKTTFVKYLINKIKEKFPNIDTVFLDQDYSNLDFTKTVYESISTNSKLNNFEIRKILGNFLFYKDEEISKKVSVLSGGERCRLSLAILTSKGSDIVVLDEPTNNIDLETKQVLIEAINNFTGVLIVISHDEDFISEIDINKTFSL